MLNENLFFTIKSKVRNLYKEKIPLLIRSFPYDFDTEEIKIIKSVKPYTMTSEQRIVSLIRAVRHISKNRISGDMVECGVWRGGSMMAIILTLVKLENTTKHLWLYDTFEGMSKPNKIDLSPFNITALERWKTIEKWCYSSFEEVKHNVYKLGYPHKLMHLVKGRVEDTIPTIIPKTISLLRLDTDWYKSTKHELVHLFPRLVKGGIILIDDYGYWKGARKAVDEYIEENRINIFLSRIDETGRIGIKT